MIIFFAFLFKGYSRKGAALFQLQRLDDAESAYKDGLMKSPDNATLKSSLAEVKAVRGWFHGVCLYTHMCCNPYQFRSKIYTIESGWGQ